MKSIPVYLDRYPAKMVTTLADKIVDEYVNEYSTILDPFCGSGALLKSAVKTNSTLYGFDVNPYAILLSHVKLNGFDCSKAMSLWEELLSEARNTPHTLTTTYGNVDYWFTALTLKKLYQIRFVLKKSECLQNDERNAILLAFALSIRLVSKADQRSPKPFISKQAIEARKGRHFDPFSIITGLLYKLSELYPKVGRKSTRLFCNNSLDQFNNTEANYFTHIITSPPYINAQDYFRNSKLELYFLEGLLPFSANSVKQQFIGTEAGRMPEIGHLESEFVMASVNAVRESNPRLAKVVNKYFSDMNVMLEHAYDKLKLGGRLIIVCGDNVVANKQITTWALLNHLAETHGFVVVDQFKDRILKRSLPPRRMGHKSLIKDETVTVLQK